MREQLLWAEESHDEGDEELKTYCPVCKCIQSCTRNKGYTPETGLDPLLNEYQCDACRSLFYDRKKL